jgi:hypothetical protein
MIRRSSITERPVRNPRTVSRKIQDRLSASEVDVARLRRVGAARFPARVEWPPVWTLVVAASFCGYFVFLFVCELVRPVNPGFTADSHGGRGVVISTVRGGTPAAAAGLLVGDHLVSVNGL